MSGHGAPIPMTSRPCGPLKGVADVPGDKSISHRSLILGALAVGETRVTGLLEGEDVLDTAKAMQAFGAEVVNHGSGNWSVFGVGVGGFADIASGVKIKPCNQFIIGSITKPITTTVTFALIDDGILTLNDPMTKWLDKSITDRIPNGDEIQLKLQKAIAILPEKQKLVFNMKYFQELKYEEISEILETSVGGLKASYHLAVKKIEAYLKED